jgi:cell division protein FtsX
MAGIVVVALTVFFLTLMLFRRRTLDASIRSNKKILRKTSIVVQLTVSIVFAFCALIILKQMYYLHNTSDLGFSFKNRGSINIQISHDQTTVLNDKMKQIPEITKTVVGHSPMLPQPFPYLGIGISDWEDKPKDAEYLFINGLNISEEYSKFYELELVEGEFLRDDDDKKYVLINESAAKAFGWYKSVGKSFYNYVVKGVVKNIYNSAPTIAPSPLMYGHRDSNHNSLLYSVLFKYDEGNWKTCIEKIKKIVEKEFPNRYFEYHNAEEEYNKYLKSENALLAILTAVSLVCLMVCIFGFVSMVSLTCEERRKEIAIRKINGATIKDILDIFFKEYLTLLAIGALIAFPLGYIIMKRWLQQYVLQTEMSAWVYLSILLALILVIILCVGGRVYKTSRENPVNALNK